MMRVGRLSVVVALVALTGCLGQPGDGSRPAGPEDGAAWNAKFEARRFVYDARSYAVQLKPVDIEQARPAHGLINRPEMSALQLAVSRAGGPEFAKTATDRREAGRVAAAYCRHLGFVMAADTGARGAPRFLPGKITGGVSEWTFLHHCAPPKVIARGAQ